MTDALASTWRNVRKVLAIRLDNMGDVLMATPALAAIREGLPEARLTLLTSSSGAALLPHLDAVDDAIAFAAPWVRHESAGTLPATLGSGEAELVARLAAARFDAAVVFTSCTQSALPAALLCRMAGIPLRLAHCRENPYGLLSDRVAETDAIGTGMRHEVARQLDLVGAVGLSTSDERLRFAVRQTDRLALRSRLYAIGLDPSRPSFIVHPGASAPSRRYPAGRFGIAAERIAEASGLVPVFIGSADEAGLVDEARAAMRRSTRSHSLVGALSLGELGAAIESAELLVCNNSGPAHLAAALGTPVVDLYALTNPQHTPWRVPARVLNHDVPCRHCLQSRCPAGHHDCLQRVEPGTVAAAALELLGLRPDRNQASTRPIALHRHVDALKDLTT